MTDHVALANEHLESAQQTNGFTGMMHAGVAQAHALLALVEVLSPGDPERKDGLRLLVEGVPRPDLLKVIHSPQPTVQCAGCGEPILQGTATVRIPDGMRETHSWPDGLWHPGCWAEAQP